MQLPEFLTEEPAGAIRLTGHRIALEHLVFFYNQGYVPEMILHQFPSLSLAVIYKVIAFYLENQQEVDAYVAGSAEEVALQRANAPPSPTLVELRRRAAQLTQSAST